MLADWSGQFYVYLNLHVFIQPLSVKAGWAALTGELSKQVKLCNSKGSGIWKLYTRVSSRIFWNCGGRLVHFFFILISPDVIKQMWLDIVERINVVWERKKWGQNSLNLFINMHQYGRANKMLECQI